MSTLVELYKNSCKELMNEPSIKTVVDAVTRVSGTNHFSTSDDRLSFDAQGFMNSTANKNVNTGTNVTNASNNFSRLKEKIKAAIDTLRRQYDGAVEAIRSGGEQPSVESFVKAIAFYYYIKLMIVVFITVQTKHLVSAQSTCARGNEVSSEQQARIAALEAELAAKKEEASALSIAKQELEGKLQATQMELDGLTVDRNSLASQLKNTAAERNAINADRKAKNALLTNSGVSCDAKEKGMNNYKTVANKADDMILNIRNSLKDTIEKLQLVLTAKGNPANANVTSVTQALNAAAIEFAKPGADKNIPDHMVNESYSDPEQKLKSIKESSMIANERIRLIALAVDAILQEKEAIEKKNQELISFMSESLPIMSNLTLSDANTLPMQP